MAQILIDEGVKPDLDTLHTYVKATYPDLRKCINTVQMNSQDGVLLKPNESDKNEADWKFEMVELFKAGEITKARKLVCASARAEEMEEVRKHQVWMKVPVKECWDMSRKKPVATRWLDINKGDSVNPEYRSRLVAKDFKDSKREDLFAATPPLEAT